MLFDTHEKTSGIRRRLRSPQISSSGSTMFSRKLLSALCWFYGVFKGLQHPILATRLLQQTLGRC